jgi:hypothetical protein
MPHPLNLIIKSTMLIYLKQFNLLKRHLLSWICKGQSSIYPLKILGNNGFKVNLNQSFRLKYGILIGKCVDQYIKDSNQGNLLLSFGQLYVIAIKREIALLQGE